MSDLPKLAKDIGLMAPKNARRGGAIAKAILAGGTLISGGGLNAAVVLPSNSPTLEDTRQPAPLILQSADATLQLQDHSSHSSHNSHSSHSSHSSHTSSGF